MLFAPVFLGPPNAHFHIRMPKTEHPNLSDTQRLQMSEPTKYIVRCCEMRKRRQTVKLPPVTNAPRIRISFES